MTNGMVKYSVVHIGISLSTISTYCVMHDSAGWDYPKYHPVMLLGAPAKCVRWVIMQS